MQALKCRVKTKKTEKIKNENERQMVTENYTRRP